MASSETIGSVIYECVRSGTTVTVEECSPIARDKMHMWIQSFS